MFTCKNSRMTDAVVKVKIKNVFVGEKLSFKYSYDIYDFLTVLHSLVRGRERFAGYGRSFLTDVTRKRMTSLGSWGMGKVTHAFEAASVILFYARNLGGTDALTCHCNGGKSGINGSACYLPQCFVDSARAD